MNFKILCLSLLVSSFSFGICNQLELSPNLSPVGFMHSRNSGLSWFAPHHSASDVITVTGHDMTINSKFSYGPLSKDLQDESIEAWIDTCGESLVRLGVFQTDSDGRIKPTFSANELPGVGAYRIWMRVMGDNTKTSFTLRILNPGTKLTIFDIDGTLTLSNVDHSPRDGAADMTHFFKKAGQEVVYLSGRHYLLTRMTRDLIEESGFAEGSLIVGQSLLDILPISSSVGEFKSSYLNYLKDLGLVLERGYGNDKSDIYAYQQAGIPSNRIFILGGNGGVKGSVALGKDFLTHLAWLNSGQDSGFADKLASNEGPAL